MLPQINAIIQKTTNAAETVAVFFMDLVIYRAPTLYTYSEDRRVLTVKPQSAEATAQDGDRVEKFYRNPLFHN